MLCKSVTGDMTRDVDDCGLLRQFTLSDARGNRIAGGKAFEIALADSLPLSVGQDGIIGRRVSMRRKGVLLADGIVGFNF